LGIQGGQVIDVGEVARPSGGVSSNGGVSMRFVRNNDMPRRRAICPVTGGAAAGRRRHLPAAGAGAPNAAAKGRVSVQNSRVLHDASGCFRPSEFLRKAQERTFHDDGTLLSV
jgi:hypothetical protein